ncbi:MAG TPA: 3-methyl-2-oxobutanoate hydroxymethyltransferase [Longimicrobiales bacterium]|nr:3-methyl-2-oxobutanoate hydroxymethyltransferase [Longimicrobiales bacterium]
MSSHSSDSTRRVTTHALVRMKEEGRRIVCLTAYDALFGRILDESDVDIVLVGDSLGQVVCGFDSTIPVTLEAMIHHAAAVRRGVRRALLVADMPFMTFQISPEETLRNAGRLLRESGAEAVKLEGGGESTLPHVRKLVRAGIPVMGHVGLTPQSVHALGGYRVQGRDRENAERIEVEAAALEDAGAFSIVLELLPRALAGRITAALSVPTIGIGAGPEVDGQVLVLPDMLGLNEAFEPRFLRRFGQLGEAAREAVAAYAEAVRAGEYPADEHSFE